MNIYIAIFDQDIVRAENTKHFVAQLFHQLHFPCEIHILLDRASLMAVRHQVQLLLLDIDHDPKAIETGMQIKHTNKDCLIVLNSKNGAKLRQGYLTQATYYMIDSTSFSQFEKALKPALIHSFQNHLSFYDPSVSSTRIALHDILYFEFQRKTTYMILCSGQKIKTPYPLHVWMKKLRNTGFAQCFKSIYVRLDAILKIEKNEITLLNKQTLPLSRKYKPEFLEAWKDHTQVE